MVKPPEQFKDVVINERTFRVKKFNALVGGFMLIKVTGLAAPLLKGLDISKFKDVSVEGKEPLDLLSGINFASILGELGKIPEDDFKYIQEKCLNVCSEVLPSGLTPVMNTANGTFAVMGLEDDTMTVLALTVHALMHNVSGFFPGSLLASLAGGNSTSSPQN